MSWRPHPALEAFPPLGAAEYRMLVRSIAADGQLEPLTIHNEWLLDGRARLLVCRELGIDPAITSWSGDPDRIPDWIVARNAVRRHLDRSQLAMVAARLLPHLAPAARERQLRGTFAHKCDKGTAAARAGAALGVSATYVRYALELEAAAPDLAAEIHTGRLKLTRAKQLLDRRRAEAAVAAWDRALPAGLFGLIVIDPPWLFPRLPYPTMTLTEIAALEIPAADDAVLFLWTLRSLVPDAIALLPGWGFEYDDLRAWRKPESRPVDVDGPEIEPIIVGRKGNPRRLGRRTVLFDGPVREHSRKPDTFYDAVAREYPLAHRLDMFGRERRAGWEVWGAEADLFTNQEARVATA